MAIGAPWRGRLLDRLGLRRALAPSVVIEAAVWTAAPCLGFEALVVAAAVAGLFVVRVFSVVRQSLAVLVPAAEQRTATERSHKRALMRRVRPIDASSPVSIDELA